MTDRPGRVAAIAVLVAVAAACAAPAPTVPRSTPQPSTDPQPSRSASPLSPSPAEVVVDPGLLDLLPASVGGLTLTATPESDAVVVADSAVRANGEAVATAIAIDPAGEFAHATLVRLRDGAFDDEFLRSWQQSFDEGFCEQAGGIVGTAEATIGAYETLIGSCAGGAHTYHVWLVDERVLLSVTSVGERRLGEQLIEGIE